MACSVIREADRRNRLSSRTLQPTSARGLRFECFLFHLKYLFFEKPLRAAIFQTKNILFSKEVCRFLRMVFEKTRPLPCFCTYFAIIMLLRRKTIVFTRA